MKGFVVLIALMMCGIALAEEKTTWDDYNTEACQEYWLWHHSDIARQLTHDQGVELVIFRESNAEKMNISSGMDKVNATRIVNAVDGVFAANRDGTMASAELMNTSLAVLQELAPEHCGEGSAIQVLAKNFDSWSHGGEFVCAKGAMCVGSGE